MGTSKYVSNLALTVSLLFMVSGCGIKGPLYLSKDQPVSEQEPLSKTTESTNNAEPKAN